MGNDLTILLEGTTRAIRDALSGTMFGAALDDVGPNYRQNVERTNNALLAIVPTIVDVGELIRLLKGTSDARAAHRAWLNGLPESLVDREQLAIAKCETIIRKTKILSGHYSVYEFAATVIGLYLGSDSIFCGRSDLSNGVVFIISQMDDDSPTFRADGVTVANEITNCQYEGARGLPAAVMLAHAMRELHRRQRKTQRGSSAPRGSGGSTDGGPTDGGPSRPTPVPSPDGTPEHWLRLAHQGIKRDGKLQPAAAMLIAGLVNDCLPLMATGRNRDVIEALIQANGTLTSWLTEMLRQAAA